MAKDRSPRLRTVVPDDRSLIGRSVPPALASAPAGARTPTARLRTAITIALRIIATPFAWALGGRLFVPVKPESAVEDALVHRASHRRSGFAVGRFPTFCYPGSMLPAR